MGGMTAFGKPILPGMASAILDSPSLNAAPSIGAPDSVPSNELANCYAQLLAIADKTARLEYDQNRKMLLAEHIAFYDRAVREAIEAMKAGGGPAPTIAPPMSMQAPPPQMPPGAPGMAPPGAPGMGDPGMPPPPMPQMMQ